MSTVRDLSFPHPVIVFDGGPHWWRVEVAASRPLTVDGVSAFIRYEDEVATRFGYIVSRWVTEDAHGVYAEVFVYSIRATDSGAPPRGHPSNDRRFRTVAIELTARPGSTATPFHPRPTQPPLWAQAAPGDELVPLAVYPSPQGLTHVSILGAGLLPQKTDLLLSARDLPERLAGSSAPVCAEVFSYDVRQREKVEARILAGRARPTATLTIGTLEQFRAVSGRQ